MLKDMRNYIILSLLLLSGSGILYADELPETDIPDGGGVGVPQENPAPSQAPQKIINFGIPKYELIRPQWGVELTSSLSAFGQNALVQSQGTKPIYAFSLLAEYLPPFVQDVGVLGIGPTFTAYPIFSGGVTTSFVSLWAPGIQVRYQARYFRNQWLVPVVAYSAEYFNYHFTSGAAGTLWIQGPTYGAWLLLNVIEPSAASQFYIEQRILRSYLVFEVRNFSGSDSFLRTSGASYYFGLRVEF